MSIMALLVVLIWPTMALPSMAASFAQDDSKWIEVEAEGRGRTAIEARKAAMLAALRKIAGEFLVQNTAMENDQITDDTLLTFTTQKAFESEDLEGFPTIEGDGTWYVKMKIRVIARDFKRVIGWQPNAASGKQTVEAEGIGNSAADAERNAIANGVRQIVGEYIESEIVINDERVVKDLIKSYTTSKNVTSERIGNYRAVGDEVAVTMRVTAELEPLYAMFRERSISATVIDGDVLAAELDLARDNIVAQRKILRNLLKELPTRLLVARLIDRQGNPIENGRPSKEDMKPIVDGDGEQFAIAINVECYFDLDTFYNRVAPALSRALEAMAVSSVSRQLDVPGQAAHIGTSLFTNESPRRGWYFGGSDLSNSNISPDNCLVIIPRGRDTNGTQLDLDFFVIPGELLSAFNNVVGGGGLGLSYWQKGMDLYRHLFLVVRVDFLDAEGESLMSTEVNPACMWRNGSGARPMGRDLPVRADISFLSCFNQLWRNSDINVAMIEPSFRGDDGVYSTYDTSVWRLEVRMQPSTFERLDRIELTAQLYQTSDVNDRNLIQRKLVNEDLEPSSPGWKDAKGNSIEPGGAYKRVER